MVEGTRQFVQSKCMQIGCGNPNRYTYDEYDAEADQVENDYGHNTLIPSVLI